MTEMFSYVVENWEMIAGAVFAFLGFVGTVVKLTPTETDNKIFQMVYNVFSKVDSLVPDNKGKVDAKTSDTNA